LFCSSDENDIDLALAKTVGENLLREEVLVGEVNILQYMMRNNMLERYYTEAIGYPILNHVGTGLMAQLCHKFPRMNILEVGAGTGSATASILGRIGEAYTSYTYTDISSGFFERAGERFQVHAHKTVFKTLDISKDPTTQGFSPQSYDVVVATNVLHATTPLKETLRNARRLLKPGGYLVNMELAQSDAMRFTLVVGCLPGWWVGEGDGRRGGPLLTPAEWENILGETGFAVDTISEQVDREDAWVAMAARAVDEQVATMIKPLGDGAPKAGKRGHLLVIGGREAAALALREQASSILKPYFTDVIYLDGLASLEPQTEVLERQHVLMLTECDANLWENIDELSFENLKRVLAKAASVLWLLQGSQDSNPYAGVTLGFLRTLYYELPDTKVQTLDVGANFGELTSNLLAECMLRLRETAERGPLIGELDRVLWSAEPELFLQDNRLYVPRLKCDEHQNARYNSAKRRITRRLEISQSATPLDLVWDEKAPIGVIDFKGSYILREQHEFRTAPSSSGIDDNSFVTLRLTCSFLSSLKTPAGFFFVCLGEDVQTGVKTLCFSDRQASIVTVPRPWTIPLLESTALEDVGFISFVVADLLAERVVQLLPPTGNVVIFDANPVAQALLSKRLTDVGKKVVRITSRQGSESAVYLHPHSPKRSVDAALPSDVTLYIDASDDTSADSASLGARIAASLSRVCEKIKLSRMTAREASPLPNIAPEPLTKLLQSATAFATMFSQLGPIPITGGAPIDVLPLTQVLSSAAPSPNSLVHWQIDKYLPVSVEPVYMRKDLFRPDRTYWLAGLSGSLGRSLADFLAAHNAKHIVISSRQPKVDQEWVDWHKRKGVSVAYFAR
jgi:SAM-dependent methyltransferase